MHRPHFIKTALYNKFTLALSFTIQIEPTCCCGSESNKNIKPKFIKKYELTPITEMVQLNYK